jgi:hypothetical protein
VIKYRIKIVSYDPEKYDLLRYADHDKVGFSVGYLVYKDNKLIKTSWHTSKRQLFKSIDKLLNKSDS